MRDGISLQRRLLLVGRKPRISSVLCSKSLFYLWLSKVSANEKRLYICNVYSHWLRLLSPSISSLSFLFLFLFTIFFFFLFIFLSAFVPFLFSSPYLLSCFLFSTLFPLPLPFIFPFLQRLLSPPLPFFFPFFFYFFIITSPSFLPSLIHNIISNPPSFIHSQSFLDIDGLVQERRNSSALATELRLSYPNPSIYASTATGLCLRRFIIGTMFIEWQMVQLYQD